MRTVLVTGGLRGIGLGIVTVLVEQSYRVLVADLDGPEFAEQTVREAGLSEQVEYFQTDIADHEARHALVTRAHELFSAPHVLVNNAGVAPEKRTDILFADEGSYERVMKINLQGPYLLTQQVARLMINVRVFHSGENYCVVNISSSNAIAAAISGGEYCLSKAGVSMATKLWAVRLAEYDARIADGFVPLGRWGYPADVGRAVAMLARGDLCYSTGERIRIDGGQMLERY